MEKRLYIDARMIDFSGIGVYLQNMLPRILEKECFNMTILGDRDQLSRFNWSNNLQIINATAPIYSIREQFQLISKIVDCDVFWSPHYNIPLLYRGKLAVTVHDVCHLALPEFIKGIHKKLYAKIMSKSVMRKADAIVCISEFTREELLRFTGNRKPEKTHVVYNGVDKSWFGLKKSTSPHSKPFFVYVGNVKPHKNLGRLLDAFVRIKDTIPHDMIVVGKKDGFISGDKSVLAKAESLRERVCFTGHVEDDVLKQYVSHAEFLILPSLYEGFGLPPLEAMACECPVIISSIPSLMEVCGDAAYQVDPYDVDDIANGMHKIATEEKLRKFLIGEASKRVTMFTWEKSAQQLLDILNEVAGK
jgi:glycosyltransferase involved in cell wall biosynthesis